MKIALLGYGKMGKAIEGVIDEKGGHEVILKINDSNVDDLTIENLSKADVAIEFSTPATAYDNIQKCFEANVPVVVGTTGWLDKMDEVKLQLEREGKTLFYASNYSIGVNLFFKISQDLARLMNNQPQYDVSVHEVHHTEKLDAPSGTGITIANDILANISRKSKWVNEAPDNDDELALLSYREPDVPGMHIVNYENEIDSIEIKHTAHSRLGFAQGAIMAAEWLKGKKGYFEMKDLLNFNR